MVGVLARPFCPKGQGFLCPGGGEFALSKEFPGGRPGGWLGLELTDTLASSTLDQRSVLL